MSKTKSKIIILAGGETAGPIMPLLAVAKIWKAEDPSIHPIFLDTKYSVAAHMVPRRGFEFRSMTAGKIRRYWSYKNFFSPFLIFIGIIRSLLLLASLRPILIIGAGGYVQVPVIIAAWILRIPRLIHQQDIVPSFSNRAVAVLANKITTTFEKSAKDFPQGTGFEKNYEDESKVYWIGNPCELDKTYLQSQAARDEAIKLFKLDPDWPTVLVLGGGSGAQGLNQVIAHSLPELLKTAQVIHATGIGKKVKIPKSNPKIHDRYHQYEFIDRMDLAYAISSVVITRAGIGSLTDLSVMAKPTIIVPMPSSHQESNAHFMFNAGAAIVLDQTELTPEHLGRMVKKIFFDAQLQQDLQKNISQVFPANANEKVMEIIYTLI